ncbi:MAG: hypothetical protein C5S49_07045 [Candidatus Methanogaster sp.]|nr:MAG: hypothetical protein C5S49_07045 [ANME-2 cluster archaeon]
MRSGTKDEMHHIQGAGAEVSWKSNRKNFGLIAKSIDNKEDLRQSGYLVMDLIDFRSKIG